MPYWFMVTRSFRIAWDRRYLWLLALFAGEGGGGGFNFRYSQPVGNGPSNAANFQQQVNSWIVQHEALIFTVVVAALILFIALFLLAAACEGALVRASAEHDAERDFKLAWAWQAGRATFWTIVRFRLLLFVLALPVVVIFVILAVAFIGALVVHSVITAVLVASLGVLFLLASIVYLIYLSFLDRLGTRALVLEQLMARASIARAHRLLRKRLGRALLVWLLSIGVSVVLGIVAGIGVAVLAAPALIAGIVASTGGAAALWIIVVLDLLIVVPVSLVVAGFIGAQGSTYWTLAFRRLDLDRA